MNKKKRDLLIGLIAIPMMMTTLWLGNEFKEGRLDPFGSNTPKEPPPPPPEPPGKCGFPPKRYSASKEIVEVSIFLKNRAHDPGSIDISCSYPESHEENDDCWLVYCNVRGKNAFNAKVLEKKFFLIRGPSTPDGVGKVIKEVRM